MRTPIELTRRVHAPRLTAAQRAGERPVPFGGGIAMAQTIEGFVGNALDNAKISALHIKVVALIAAGYFFDVIDLIVLGSLIPDMLQSKFATGPEAGWIGSATV